MLRFVYRCLKKRTHEICGIPIHELPDVKTLQEIANKALEYKFCYYQGIDQVEYLLEETRRDLEMLKRNFGEERPHYLYLLAVEELTIQTLSILSPIISSFFIETEDKSIPSERIQEILQELKRVREILKRIPHHHCYWQTKDKYLVLLRKIPPLERVLKEIHVADNNMA